MLTDADWNELSDLVKERLNQVLIDVLGSGVPKERGMIELGEHDRGIDRIRWGQVYVDGIPAEVRPHTEEGEAPPALFQFDRQADLPPGRDDTLIEPPGSGEYWLYVDVWERTVTSLEDNHLRDPALQGADTCTRTQTMAQVKWAETSEAVDALPQKGDAPATLTLRQGRTEPDPCDPCAEEVALDTDIGNYLFRVEVHDAEYNEDGRLLKLILKWSSENGAEQYEVQESEIDYPPGFLDYGTWTYEYFSGAEARFASEKHLGVFLQRNADYPLRGPLVHAAPPEGEEEGFSLVRRWDGYCLLTRDTPSDDWTVEGADRTSPLSTASAAEAPGHVEVGDTLTLVLNAIDVELELHYTDETDTERDRTFVPGDYWYAAVRERRHESGDVLLAAQEPQGILHHYLKLTQVIDGETFADTALWGDPEDGGEKPRRFPFPKLTELDAQDVGYTPTCPEEPGAWDLRHYLEKALGESWPGLEGRESSVRDVLDAFLCELNAAHIPLDHADTENCLLTRDEDLETVQEALNRLCERIRDLTAEDIAYTLPECAEPSLRQCLEALVDPKWKPENPGEPTDVAGVLETLLCQFNARHLPMDPTDEHLCDELKDDKTVQDALNTVCRMRRQGCVTLAFDPGDGDVSELIKTQIQADESIADVHLCFRAGEYTIQNPIVLQGKGHIKITGAGRGTRIVLDQGEKVFEFQNCQSVTMEDLHVESQKFAGHVARRNGLVTAKNCGPVQVERVSFKCAAGVRTEASCITVLCEGTAADSVKRNSRARIRECEMNIGHFQQGVLLINMRRSVVEDNLLRVVPKPKQLTFDILLNDRKRRLLLADRLLSNFKVEKGGVTAKTSGQEKTFQLGKPGKYYTVTMNSFVPAKEWKNYFENNPPEDADLQSETAFQNYVDNQIQSVENDPAKLSSYESQVNIMNLNFSGAGMFNVVDSSAMKNALRSILASDTKVEAVSPQPLASNEIVMGLTNFSVRFDSEIPKDTWNRLLQDVSSAQKTESKLYGAMRAVAEKLILDAQYRNQFGEVARWWNLIRTESNPAVARQGIVCAGYRADEVRIHGNTLEGVLEGIHVGTSSSKRSHKTYYADTVSIDRNILSLRRPVEMRRGRTGIFVGNCDHLNIENNRIKVPSFKPAKRDPYHHSWGILVHGHLGRMVLVRQNRTQHCQTGIGITALGEGGENLWRVESNLAEGALRAVKAPGFDKENNLD